ncbi:MAG: choice-of-anchor B family protein [Rhodothermales bacterium]|nr:choice-of-anchor B family protein [Rhodothermales bacterium]
MPEHPFATLSPTSYRKINERFVMKATYACVAALGLLLSIPTLAIAQNFGGAMAYEDGQLFVGQTSQSSESGTVYVYARGTDGTWTEVQRLQASDRDGSDDRFGRALDVNGGTLIVGATTKEAPLGAAYVFEKGDDGLWVQTQRLAADGESETGSLGRAIAVDGNWAFVSAAGYDESKGAVFVYERAAAGEWGLHSRLMPDSLEAGTLFGLALDMEGGKAIIGAQLQDQNSGAIYAYAYNAENNSWDLQDDVTLNGLQEGGSLGAGVAISGDRALVSAPFAGTGSAFLLEYSNDSWSQTRLLSPVDGRPGFFGAHLGLYESEIWVGAPFTNGSGAIFRYHIDEDGALRTADWFVPDSVEPGSQFGTRFVRAGDELFVGAAAADFGLGSVLVMARDGDGWTETQQLFLEQQQMDAITGAEVRCEDGTAGSFECEGVDMVSFLPVGDIGGKRGVSLNDIWGWTHEETGREFALVGRVDGMSFVEITNPANPIYLGDLPKTEGSMSASWRDMKVYRDYVYVVADGAGNHGVQIFDLNELLDVPGAPVTFSETARYDGIASAHNIVINEESGFAYTVGNSMGGEVCGGGSHILDLTNPLEPTFAGCFGHEGTGNAGTGYTHDGMCIQYDGPDSEHIGKEICFSANENAISVADLTDKQNPITLAAAEYPNVGYAHQGWITEDHRYYYSNDETDETGGTVDRTRTLVWDVSDLDDPVLVTEFMGTTGASDHNLYVRGNFMYQSNYAAGLRILDISDPANPVEVAHFDTAPDVTNTPGFGGSWSNYPFFQSGTIIVTSRNEGLFLLKKSQTEL